MKIRLIPDAPLEAISIERSVASAPFTYTAFIVQPCGAWPDTM